MVMFIKHILKFVTIFSGIKTGGASSFNSMKRIGKLSPLYYTLNRINIGYLKPRFILKMVKFTFLYNIIIGVIGSFGLITLYSFQSLLLTKGYGGFLSFVPISLEETKTAFIWLWSVSSAWLLLVSINH